MTHITIHPLQLRSVTQIVVCEPRVAESMKKVFKAFSKPRFTVFAELHSGHFLLDFGDKTEKLGLVGGFITIELD